jgi:hypothetical protein
LAKGKSLWQDRRQIGLVASAHVDELSAALPGFAEAMAWPGEGW